MYLNGTEPEAVRGTEQEVFNWAVAKNQTEFEELEDQSEGDDDIAGFGEDEGIDGRARGDEEGWDVTINGFPDTNFDRPVELARDQEHLAELAQRDAQIAQLQQLNAQQAMQLDPGWADRVHQAKEAAIDQLWRDPDGALAERAALQNRIHQLEGDRVNASLRAAHEEHGEEFERAYRGLTSMDPNHYAARALVQSIWNSEDPGAAMMEMHYATGGQAMPKAVGGQYRSGNLPPSLNSQSRGYGGSTSRSYGRSQRDSGGWPVDENRDFGGFDAASERDIMASVWR
jgi:hypothetical protein